MKAITLTNSNNKTRRKLDFYPTPPEVTLALLRFPGFYNAIHPPVRIWEPACGQGAMSKVLISYDYEVFSSDISKDSFGVSGFDFLESHGNSFDAIITNPPFNLSEQFIRHAISQASVVAMLLKSQYWHAKKRLKLFEEYPPAYVLPLSWRPDFLFDQREEGEKANPTMEVAWSVWIKEDTNTKYRILKR